MICGRIELIRGIFEVIHGRIDVIRGRTEVTGRRKQLLEDLQKRILELEGGNTRSHYVKK